MIEEEVKGEIFREGKKEITSDHERAVFTRLQHFATIPAAETYDLGAPEDVGKLKEDISQLLQAFNQEQLRLPAEAPVLEPSVKAPVATSADVQEPVL